MVTCNMRVYLYGNV